MRTTTTLFAAFGLLGAVLLVGARSVQASDSPIGVRKPVPKSIASLEKGLSALQGRIDELVKKANQDPAELKIAIYRNYTPKQMKKTRGRIRAEDIVGFMIDKEQDFSRVREKAKEALIHGARYLNDPDLSEDEKQGSRTKRAAFCDKELIGILKRANDDEVSTPGGKVKIDRLSRKLVNDLLKDWYKSAPRTHPEIRIYNQDSEPTWKSAHSAWKRFLKKQ